MPETRVGQRVRFEEPLLLFELKGFMHTPVPLPPLCMSYLHPLTLRCLSSLHWPAVSCYAFAAAAALESLTVIKFGTGYRWWRSPQQIMDCSFAYGNNGCNKGLASYAFRYMCSYGLTYENNYAYEGVTRACRRKSVRRDYLCRAGMLPLCSSNRQGQHYHNCSIGAYLVRTFLPLEAFTSCRQSHLTNRPILPP